MHPTASLTANRVCQSRVLRSLVTVLRVITVSRSREIWTPLTQKDYLAAATRKNLLRILSDCGFASPCCPFPPRTFLRKSHASRDGEGGIIFDGSSSVVIGW